MSDYSFGTGEFFLIEEVITQCRAPGNFDGKSVRILGIVEHFDVVGNRVLLKHNASTIEVDTSFIGPCPFHKGWLFQFIGEIDNSAVRSCKLVSAKVMRFVSTLCLLITAKMWTWNIWHFNFCPYVSRKSPTSVHARQPTNDASISLYTCV